ncbi:hypothetical protein ABVB69_07340 [Streptomyces sp. NPDC000349]|uniref:hypothetical protein n=1 Tax=Streptomyces sp. NPDC000349 TaxID=3154249 RepID=UPI00336AE49C
MRSDVDDARAVLGPTPEAQGVPGDLEFERGELTLRPVQADGGRLSGRRGKPLPIGLPLRERPPGHLHVDEAALLLGPEADLDRVAASALLLDVLNADVRLALLAQPLVDGSADVQVVGAARTECGAAAPDGRAVGEVRLLVVAGSQREKLAAPPEESAAGEGVGAVILSQSGRGLLLVRKEERAMTVGPAQHGRLHPTGVFFTSH